MNPKIELSANENIVLEQMLAIQTKRMKYNITLEYLTDKWSRFVTNVENGYRLTIDDYKKSLSLRDLIQEILGICPGNASLKEWASKWDNRFTKTTKVVKEPLLPPFPNENLGWWWFRIPINPGSELKKWFQITQQK